MFSSLRTTNSIFHNTTHTTFHIVFSLTPSFLNPNPSFSMLLGSDLSPFSFLVSSPPLMPPRIFSLALSFAFLLSFSIVTTRSIASYINTSVLAFTFFLFWWHIRVAWSLLFDLFPLSTAYYILILFPLSLLATLYTFFYTS